MDNTYDIVIRGIGLLTLGYLLSDALTDNPWLWVMIEFLILISAYYIYLLLLDKEKQINQDDDQEGS